ncbi:MAG: thiamine pyrophosphate-dependent enzyme, partial [Candidatus Omnitrophica bacterium]|nr:thiamine pyrophosphate-dependent enzyme [Candidatus Omnitrophota bacterium]
RQPFDNICDRVYCFGMRKTQIDGNDIFAVNEAADRAVISARNGNGPSLIECRTYRWKSHVGPKSDLELGTAPGKFLKQWMKKCPIERIEKHFDQENIISKPERKKISDAIDKEIKSAFSYAKKSPLPKPKDLFSDVISKL